MLAFLSDFGLKDPYVGIVKSVLLEINPGLSIVDITHEVPAHDIKSGAFILASCFRQFPQGTIFLAVVDPGVGSPRNGLIMSFDGHFFVGPDNGLITYLAKKAGAFSCHVIEKEHYFRRPVSPTFHARDIFAPVAAHLSLGTPPLSFGGKYNAPVLFKYLEPKIEDGKLTGQVIYIDRFGNLITDLDEGLVAGFLDHAGCTVSIRGKECQLFKTYSDAPVGGVLAVTGSSGLLEISVNCGSAKRLLDVKTGDSVVLKKGWS
ncbi:MAG: SAM-dependent chlorinase/fluorinase [Desulfobacteraceae bacterium]|nr:SAM-dependent chlorinase/fluorinase [Desulfobacteraceae bacterium]